MREKILSQVILKVASHCNLNCSYCYVYNHEDTSFLARPRFISDRVLDAVLRRVNDYCELHHGPAFRIGLHGGEPTLIGVERFKEIVTRIKARLNENIDRVSMQTNAALLDDAWAMAIRELEVAVGVSLDGPANIHDQYRVDHAGRGTHRKTIEGIKALQAVGISPTVLCVIDPRTSGRAVYEYFRSIGITVMDFLLPDVTHDSFSRFYGGVGPTPIAAFLISALDAWMEEDNPDVSVRIFENLLARLLGGAGATDGFGNTGSSYLIVETDGSIEANDALRVCEDRIAVSGLNVLSDGFDDLKRGDPFVHAAVNGHLPLPTVCRICPERECCGGGCLPHRYSRHNGFDNASVWCEDILKILGHLRAYLEADSAHLKSGRCVEDPVRNARC